MKVTGNPEAQNGTWGQIKLEDLEQERSEVRKTVEKKTTPKFVYEMLEGMDGKYQYEDEEGLTFKANGDFNKFILAKVDGKEVDENNYTVKSGSTIITLKPTYLDTLSEGKHLKLTLRDETFFMNAIGFNIGNLAEEYKIGDRIDVVGALEINQYNGNETIQMNLKDIRKSY